MLRTARTVSPTWLRSRTRPPFQRNWDAAEALLLADPLERRRIQELSKDLVHHGFHRPVVVRRECWFDRRPRVYDGMHRSIAAMRVGIAIPIVGDYPADYDEDIYTAAVAGADIDHLLDAALSLSSFRSTAGPWIQCDMASGRPGVGLRLYLPRHPELRLIIAAQLEERLHSVGIDAQVVFLEEYD